MNSISYKQIQEFTQSIANAHVDIKDFYRVDFEELQGALRTNIKGFPVLMMEAPSVVLSSESKGVSTFGTREMSLLVLTNVSERENFQETENALDTAHRIALDIVSYLKKCANDENHLLFGRFDINTVRLEKVGPIIDNLYGWNLLYEIKSFESMVFNPSKWQFE